jgi:hypothetical protein
MNDNDEDDIVNMREFFIEVFLAFICCSCERDNNFKDGNILELMHNQKEM